jgi:hypothetical protein
LLLRIDPSAHPCSCKSYSSIVRLSPARRTSRDLSLCQTYSMILQVSVVYGLWREFGISTGRTLCIGYFRIEGWVCSAVEAGIEWTMVNGSGAAHSKLLLMTAWIASYLQAVSQTIELRSADVACPAVNAFSCVLTYERHQRLGSM